MCPKFFNALSTSALQNRTYKDGDKTYEIHFQMHYIKVDPENSNDPNFHAYQETLKASPGTNKNNIIFSENEGSSSLWLDENGKRTRSNAS